ncbi:MAG: divergent polysaccharide deacetylase family protein [Deltaproteobacteria bacterium]|nr:divergent polysaccharide deacetylase family protein [Deltaproteobacteria bacterium]
MKNRILYSKKSVKGRVFYSEKRSPVMWVCLITLFAAAFFAGYSLYCWRYSQTATVSIPSEKKGLDVKVAENREERASVRQKDKKSEKAGAENRIAIVMDDMGHDLLSLHDLLQIDAPITVSVLPHLAHSVTVAQEAYRAGREVLLHLPMEPNCYPGKRPGRGALLLRMDRDEIIEQLEEDIMDVPHISGVNNHMGSKFMEDEEKVEIVLEQLKNKGLFFLDSLTTKNSKGIDVARKIGLRHGKRDIFLDNNCDFKDTLDILYRIAEKRDEWNTMVIIGHPHESTIRAISEAQSVFRDRHIHIVPLSDLVE